MSAKFNQKCPDETNEFWVDNIICSGNETEVRDCQLTFRGLDIPGCNS